MAEALAFPARQGAAVRRRPESTPRPPEPGTVHGGVRVLLRIEGLAVLAAAVAAYDQFGAGWGFFALLFLAPDLSFADEAGLYRGIQGLRFEAPRPSS